MKNTKKINVFHSGGISIERNPSLAVYKDFVGEISYDQTTHSVIKKLNTNIIFTPNLVSTRPATSHSFGKRVSPPQLIPIRIKSRLTKRARVSPSN